MGTLLVVVGPIASGKSSVSDGLAARLRDAGRVVAVLDVDQLVETVGGFVGLTMSRFEQAVRVFGELVSAWLREGVDVIAHGPFFRADEDEAVTAAARAAGVRVLRVRLEATYEVAVQRVQIDPTRQASVDPQFLRATYDRVTYCFGRRPIPTGPSTPRRRR